jgi:hypothetical protein
MTERATIRLTRQEYDELLRLADYRLALAQSSLARSAVLDPREPIDLDEVTRSYDASLRLLNRLRKAEWS